jgi:hypothetical protein
VVRGPEKDASHQPAPNRITAQQPGFRDCDAEMLEFQPPVARRKTLGIIGKDMHMPGNGQT